MVIGAVKNLINTLLQYPFVTHWLYIPRFLGLNMKDADKTLTDSVLSVFRFANSNKTATKVMKKAPLMRCWSK